jgi:DNA-binding MarR family transcriptional regulator
MRIRRPSKPFRSLEDEVFVNLLRTAAHLEGELASQLKRSGISLPQYNVLRILRDAGRDGLPSLEIASRMITRVPDITRLVDRLERAGLVARVRSDTDRRVVLVNVTRAGQTLVHNLDDPTHARIKTLLSHLSRRTLQTLNHLLLKSGSR